MASRADEYRRRAQQCLEMAAAFSDGNARFALSHMAEAWLRLAERNDLIPPVTTECAQPVVQQQQQVQAKHNGRDFEYYIKSANEQHQRVAGERELAKP